jgi:outer membrane beta-barrel protein
MASAWTLAGLCALAGAGQDAAAGGTSDAGGDEPEARAAAAEHGEEAAGPARVACLEDVDELGRPRKGVQQRDFLKRLRFELSAVGGLYASDVVSSTYIYGGALSFFAAEDFGLELLVGRAPVEFRLEQPFTAFDQAQRFAAGQAWHALGALLFSPVHAKFRFAGAAIVHGDVFLVAGAGRTVHDSVQGFTWHGGVGLKLYLARHVSLRIDLRDLVVAQEVLGRGRITHNVALLAGVGAWLP